MQRHCGTTEGQSWKGPQEITRATLLQMLPRAPQGMWAPTLPQSAAASPLCSSSKFSLTEFVCLHQPRWTQHCNPFLPCPATLLRTFSPCREYLGFVTVPSDTPLVTAPRLSTRKLCTLDGDRSTLVFQEARIPQQRAAIRYYITSTSNAIISTANGTIPNYSLLVLFLNSPSFFTSVRKIITL